MKIFNILPYRRSFGAFSNTHLISRYWTLILYFKEQIWDSKNYQSSVFSAVNILLFQDYRLWHNNKQIQHTERIPKSRKLHHESIHFKKTWGIKITTSVLKLNFLSNWNTFKRAQQEILIPVIQRFGRLSSKIPFDKTAVPFLSHDCPSGQLWFSQFNFSQNFLFRKS